MSEDTCCRSSPGGSAERPSVTEARHGLDEGPAHWVIVSPFWMDCYVTNAQFRKFVVATGHVTIAAIAPHPSDYPGALPDTLHPSSLVFVRPNSIAETRRYRSALRSLKVQTRDDHNEHT
jgi:formylglycine-generating enzyme